MGGCDDGVCPVGGGGGLSPETRAGSPPSSPSHTGTETPELHSLQPDDTGEVPVGHLLCEMTIKMVEVQFVLDMARQNTTSHK